MCFTLFHNDKNYFLKEIKIACGNKKNRLIIANKMQMYINKVPILVKDILPLFFFKSTNSFFLYIYNCDKLVLSSGKVFFYFL